MDDASVEQRRTEDRVDSGCAKGHERKATSGGMMMNEERNCVEALVEDASDTCTVHGRVRIRSHAKEGTRRVGIAIVVVGSGAEGRGQHVDGLQIGKATVSR